MDGIINSGQGLLNPFIYAGIFMLAMLGLIITIKLVMAAAARGKQATREAAAERRLIAIETALEDVRERLERLEKSVGGPPR